ncbi:hypothetical protein bpr_I1760 [Butyrivibrio proteoclasticus B316]|uniref:Uncharacterized protein n=1 Tax=Butyrivibrio proteoclasticus (strain ATCC 51982 / DSM 14932 / B316) TaxID=515622 RepID=E0RV77_BUTPB|nr:hypothetical protein [Butyrivibrio proteoclasticus]ADL34496.1 hypothetical protein bpr_I1760 [Butyrivibrio proteoclasticus B316]
MEQQKLFYNVCNDLWSFAKTLNKSKNEMTDEDWTAAVELLEKTAQKYKTLGNNEYDLAYSSMMGILDYIEKGER